MACVVFWIAARDGVFVAAGADSYGYVSQARLWASGQLRVAQPFVRELPAAIGDEVLAPLGYRPARVVGLPGGIVPTYSPGLPMVMAAFQLVAGEQAVYFVVPVLAAGLVWVTFLLGRRLAGPWSGLAAAALLASSPAFLGSAMRPMSDLPVAFWWALALVAAATPGARMAALSGVATSVAVLTRPNLVLLGLAVGVPLLRDALRGADLPASRRRLAWYALTAAAGPIAVAVINNHLYGSPMRSGYGALEDIYALAHVFPNLQRYPAWFRETQTALPALGLLAPLLLWRRADVAETPGNGWPTARLAWSALGLALLTVASYLAYMPFDEWMYLRFLLPAYPAVFALFAMAIARVTRRLGTRVRAPLVVMIVGALCLYAGRQAVERSVFRWHADDQRYVLMGRFVREHLPRHAVVLAMQHSGSARYYSGRVTLRYDMLEPDQLDPLVADLGRKGYPCYVLVEHWEVGRFRDHFARASTWARLDWTPMAVAGTLTRVYLFDPRQRDAPLAAPFRVE